MIATLQYVKPGKWAKVLAIAMWALPLAGYSVTITQTVDSASSSTDWNTSLWGSPADSPFSGNDYISAPGLRSAAATRIGAPDATAFVRFYGTSTAFEGDSLTVVGSTELLLKQTANEVADANIILDGGSLRLSAGSSSQGSVTGTLYVASESWLGVADLGTPVLTVGSAITGTNMLHIGSGLGDPGSGTIRFAGDLTGFAGTLEMGGGDVAGTIEFAQSYNATNTTLALRNPSTDIINLTTNVTFLALNYGTNSLPVGTYTAAEINASYVGNGIQFIGTNGTLSVITAPYPAPQPPANTNIVIQVANAGGSDSWNGPLIWGAQTTVSNKDYFSSSSLYGSGQANQVNYGSILGRVRALATDTNFYGNSLTMLDNTELLVKSEGGFTNTCDNLIVEGALVRYSPNSGTSGALAGNLTVASNSVIGVEQVGASTFTIASALHGSGDLSLRAGRTTQTLIISGDLSDYTGGLVLGEGTTALILDFDQDYDLPDMDVSILVNTNFADSINLDQVIKVKTFALGDSYLPVGAAYTAIELDTYFGTTNRFTDGGGTLEVYETVTTGPTVDPVFTSIVVNGSDVTLSWTDEGVGTYSIQHKTNLTDVTWSNVMTNLPAGLGSTNVTASGADQEFYQIIGE